VYTLTGFPEKALLTGQQMCAFHDRFRIADHQCLIFVLSQVSDSRPGAPKGRGTGRVPRDLGHPPEGNITAVDDGSTAQYVYDALNDRVQTVANGATTGFIFNPNGQRVSEWSGNTELKGQYYWGGTPVAFYSGGDTYFQHRDWLGTERMQTTYNGSVEGTSTSLPFGDAQTTFSGADPNLYASLDYDSETNTDHAQFRQYNNTQGHWMSADPYYGSYDFTNPQSFNRYAYALDEPLSSTDPLGLDGDPPPPPPENGLPLSCYLDSILVSCPFAFASEGSGAAVACGNLCSLAGQWFYGPADAAGDPGVPYEIVGGVNGLEWVNQYGNEVDSGPDGTGDGELPFGLGDPVMSIGFSAAFSGGSPNNPWKPSVPDPGKPYFSAYCTGGGLSLTKWGCTYACGAIETGSAISPWITIGDIEISPQQIWAECPTGAAEAFCPNTIIVEGNVDPTSGAVSNTRIMSCRSW
jgi:RHS repeat-associated protein